MVSAGEIDPTGGEPYWPRFRIFWTVLGYHFPPRMVRIPRLFSASARP